MSVSAAGKQEDEESMVGFSFTSSKVKGSDQQLPKVPVDWVCQQARAECHCAAPVCTES